MDIFHSILVLHIIAGSICLLTGAISSAAKKRKGIHTKVGEIYHGAYVFIFITAVIMAIMHWYQSAYLFFIATFSYGLALFGYLARKFRWKNWIRKHIGGMLGSYIGIITAVLVVNGSKIPFIMDLPPLSLWFLPTIIGTPIIIRVSQRYQSFKKVKG